jgi:5'-methylthioadenosine phosphorylase
MPEVKIAVIGGSGLYNIKGFTFSGEVTMNTPFGKPSDSITIGHLGDREVAFLPRHGRGHHILPTEIPVRANIWALKSLGVEHIIAVNSVGSFREALKPGDLLIPDQLIDRTRQRVSTFFGDGVVAHVPFGEPVCPELSQVLFNAGREVGASIHQGGTYVVMEGPAFSTRAESRLYRAWGADVIGMTALPEAKLAREAEICYGIIACVTDYDSWQKVREPVTFDVIRGIMRKNIDIALEIIRRSVDHVSLERSCECARALETAIATAPALIPDAQKQKLGLLIGKYIH